MKMPPRAAWLAGLAAAASLAAVAQQPAPSFAPPNLSEAGVAALARNCAACHGTGGRPVQGSPLGALAGKSRDEIVQAMAQFKAGTKPATLMHQISKGYSEAEVAALADYFSKQKR